MSVRLANGLIGAVLFVATTHSALGQFENTTAAKPDLFQSQNADDPMAQHPINRQEETSDRIATDIQSKRNSWRQANGLLKQKLEQPMEVEFFETPLEEVLYYFQSQSDIQFLIDYASLENLGLDSSFPVTLKLADVPVRCVLDAILSPKELAYVVSDGFLLVTSQEEAGNKLETRVYDVDALLHPNQPLESIDVLLHLIVSTIEPDSWSDNGGGPGTINAYQTLLVVGQTQRNHDAIEALLRELTERIVAAGGPKLPVTQSRTPRREGRVGIGERRRSS